MIRVPQVRVVDDEGQQLGVMPTQQALAMAQERGLDLVEVAPTAAPPVVRFLDFGQYKYELTKREKEAKRKQRAVEFKEVRLTPKIGQGDFDTKVHRAIEFLEDGDRIKVTVRFRGRELTHPEIGRTLLARFGDKVKDHGTVDRTPVLEGKSMFMTLASVHKPRVHEHKLHGQRPDGEHPDDALGIEPEDAPVAEGAAPTAAVAQAAVETEAVATAEPAGGDAGGRVGGSRSRSRPQSRSLLSQPRSRRRRSRPQNRSRSRPQSRRQPPKQNQLLNRRQSPKPRQ